MAKRARGRARPALPARSAVRTVTWAIVVALGLVACSPSLLASDSLSDLSQAYRRLYKKLGPQVVGVRVFAARAEGESEPESDRNASTRVPTPVSSASGLVWSKDGTIVTIFSAGVPKDRELTIEVQLHDGTLHEARHIATDDKSGIALLELTDTPRTLKPVRPSLAALEVGSLAFTVGAGGSLQSGLVKSTTYRVRGAAGGFSFPRAVGTSIPAQPGDVGGLLADDQGRMIGLLAFESRNSQGALDELPKRGALPEHGIWGSRIPRAAGFGHGGQVEVPSLAPGRALAIPADLVVRIADQLARSGRVARGEIGASFTAVCAEDLGLPVMERRMFAKVVWLDPEGTAYASGLREGDAIVQVEDRLLRTVDDLFWFAEQVELGSVGGHLEVQFIRRSPQQPGPGPILRAKIAVAPDVVEDTPERRENRIPVLIVREKHSGLRTP